MYNTGNKVVICQLQNANPNFQSSAKFMSDNKQNINLVHLCMHLVETFPLVLNSKIIFKKLSCLKLSTLKK